MNAVDLSNFTSFRELDVQYAQDKGWAFKRFKHLNTELVEGEDYVWFHQLDDAKLINQLREAGRIYASTANLVMLSPSGTTKITQDLSNSST
ncbi:MAG: hypothetical protein OXT49_04995 [Gammaproteobacteria bacterium]|nr:hypothetical protein [Gammaproteobacteria bacterium]